MTKFSLSSYLAAGAPTHPHIYDPEQAADLMDSALLSVLKLLREQHGPRVAILDDQSLESALLCRMAAKSFDKTYAARVVMTHDRGSECDAGVLANDTDETFVAFMGPSEIREAAEQLESEYGPMSAADSGRLIAADVATEIALSCEEVDLLISSDGMATMLGDGLEPDGTPIAEAIKAAAIDYFADPEWEHKAVSPEVLPFVRPMATESFWKVIAQCDEEALAISINTLEKAKTSTCPNQALVSLSERYGIDVDDFLTYRHPSTGHADIIAEIESLHD